MPKLEGLRSAVASFFAARYGGHVTLVAGHLDFEPLVTALVNNGTHVHVFFERKSAAKALYQAADVAKEITLEQFWEWSKLDLKRRSPIPSFDNTVYGSGRMPRN